MAGGVLIVFDDTSRIRWKHPGADSWTLDGTWPDAAEKQDVDAHLSHGGCLLVITDGQDIVTNAWPHELTATAPTVRQDLGSDGAIEIRFNHFDWLPAALRHRGDQFVARERSRWEKEPAILRPALTLDIDTGFHDQAQVIFAMTSPGVSRTWIKREVVHYLEQISTAPQVASLR